MVNVLHSKNGKTKVVRTFRNVGEAKAFMRGVISECQRWAEAVRVFGDNEACGVIHLGYMSYWEIEA